MRHHGAGLRRLLTVGKIEQREQDSLLAALESDHRQAEVSAADRAMLDYAVKLTRAAHEIEAADIEALRRNGFDDRGIHDICAIVAYFAFVNRIADGLGVELES